MPFCSQCGTEIPEDAKFCPKCGNATQGESATQSGTPTLWNPQAAVWWSALFLPLGPILHYLNWKALGKDKEADQAKLYIIVFSVWLIIVQLPFISSIAACIINLFIWLSWGWGLLMKKATMGLTGKGQVEYVSEKYGTEYNRKSWLVPLLASFGFFIVYCIFIAIIEDSMY